MIIKRDRTVVTKATPEGPAVYPFGTWGGGFILDSRAARRFAVWCRWRLWVQTGSLMIVMPDFWPVNAGFRLPLYVAACTVLLHGLYRYFVRDCRRTAVLLTASESLTMQAEAAVDGIIGSSLLVFVPLTAFIVWQSVLAPSGRWGPIAGTIDLALFVWCIVHSVRIGLLKRRLDRAPSPDRALWMRPRQEHRSP